jgi:very-short-patch-repair endonuclease
MLKRLTRDEFIEKARKIHGDKYGYDKVEYVNAHTHVTIICPDHGEFAQAPSDHIYGKQGCPACANKRRAKFRSSTREKFISSAQSVHGDKYNYDKAHYISATTKVTITCPQHGDFQQVPNSHLRSGGCPACGNVKRNLAQALTLEQFILRATRVHGDKYDYSKVNYVNYMTDVTIVCPKHGSFRQAPSNHIAGGGCPGCLQSNGEKAIAEILKSLGLRFFKQVRFPTCRAIRSLPFDFYFTLNGKRYLIEYDGRQHFEPAFSRNTIKARQIFERTKRYDAIKDQWARDNGYVLIRIPYTTENIKQALIAALAQ